MYFEKDVFPCKKKDLAKEGPYYKDVCFEHGRQETREYYVENEISWLKANHPEWKGLNGMGAKKCGKCKRAHWGVENNLPWVLNIGFWKDESRECGILLLTESN